MKRHVLLIIVLSFAVCSLNAQTAYRFSYLFLGKDRPEGNYRSSEMKLDYDGKTAFFYDENRYLADSLDLVAFNTSGDIVDEEAYGERTRLKASNPLSSYHDLSASEFVQNYVSVARFKGNMPAVMPQWELKDGQRELAGYDCKSAECEFLGRKWKVWYTEDLPVPAGPWLLWGAPGLVVYAIDEDKLFNFTLLNAQQIHESRLDKWTSYDSVLCDRKKSYALTMKEMERLYTRYRRDSDFFNSIHGSSGAYTVDKYGNRVAVAKTKPYIPLIPDDYWK